MKKLIITALALVTITGAFFMGKDYGEHSVILNQEIFYEDGFYYSDYKGECNEYYGDLWLSSVVMLMHEDEKIIVQDSDNIIYTGNVCDLQDKTILDKIVLEIAPCDNNTTVVFVE